MAENDAMEGKKLELHMFEQKMLKAIELAEKQKQDSGVISNGQLQFEIQILKEGKKVKIHAFGEEILTLEDEKFNYNLEGLKSIQEKLADNPKFDYKQFGLPDIEYLEELERQKEEQEKDADEKGEGKQKDEKDLSEKKEQEDSEKEETNSKTEEIAKKYNVDSGRVRNLSLTRKVAGKETLPELDPKSKKYEDIYIIPGKDEHSSIMLGVDKEGKEEEMELNSSKGKVPNINIKLLKKDKTYEEVKPYEYHEIDSRQGLAKIKDSAGKDEWIYCRQEEGRGKEFHGVIMPEKDTKNIDSNPKDVRDAIDPSKRSGHDLNEISDRIKEQEEYEELGAPSVGGAGVQLEETEHPERNIVAIKEELMQRDGVSLTESLKRNAIPGYYEKVDADYQKKAEQVYKLVKEDKMPYEDAVRRVKANDREQGGNTPDQNPRKRDH